MCVCVRVLSHTDLPIFVPSESARCKVQGCVETGLHVLLVFCSLRDFSDAFLYADQCCSVAQIQSCCVTRLRPFHKAQNPDTNEQGLIRLLKSMSFLETNGLQ